MLSILVTGSLRLGLRKKCGLMGLEELGVGISREKLRAERGSLTCFRKGKRNPKELVFQMQSFVYAKDKILLETHQDPQEKRSRVRLYKISIKHSGLGRKRLSKTPRVPTARRGLYQAHRKGSHVLQIATIHRATESQSPCRGCRQGPL